MDRWRISMARPASIGPSSAFGKTDVFRTFKPQAYTSPENSRATGSYTATSCQVVVA